MTPIESALESGRPPLPWLYGCAPRFENEDPREFHRDAGVQSRSLGGVATLFDLPAVCVAFDTTAGAEALGCDVRWTDDGPGIREGIVDSVGGFFELDVGAVGERGRMPAFFEAVDRLVPTLDDTSVLGGVAGPATLASQLLVDEPSAYGDDVIEEAFFTAADACLELVNGYLDRGADGIVLLEPELPPLQEGLYTEVLEPLGNVLGHYERTGLVAIRDVSVAAIDTVADLNLDGITGGVGSAEGADDLGTLVEAAQARDVTLGVGVPGEVFLEGPDAVRTFADGVPEGVLLSSRWTVPPGTGAEAIHALTGTLDG